MTRSERNDYGYKLRAMRLAVGLTVLEVSAACNTTARSVRYWETGERLPGIEHIRALAGALQVPINQLIP